MSLAPPCYSCRRYCGIVSGVGHACDAFGERSIPVEVLASQNPHVEPIDGDGGLTYEPFDDACVLNDAASIGEIGKTIRAAGIMFVAPGEELLLLRRGADHDHPGEWAFPGGKLEEGETAEDAARREAREETGWKGKEPLVEWTRRLADGVDFTTFAVRLDEKFDPALDDENDAHRWVKRSELIGDDEKRADALVEPLDRIDRPRVTVRPDGTVDVY